MIEVVSHHVLWQCPSLAPTDLFIDTGSATQNLNPDSVQRGIRGDWKTQRPCSDGHLNKLVYKNTPGEDTSANMEEWDTDHSVADRELSKNTLDNHSSTAKSLSHSLNLEKLTALENVSVAGKWNAKLVREVSLLILIMEILIIFNDRHYITAHQLINMMKKLQLQNNYRHGK